MDYVLSSLSTDSLWPREQKTHRRKLFEKRLNKYTWREMQKAKEMLAVDSSLTQLAKKWEKVFDHQKFSRLKLWTVELQV